MGGTETQLLRIIDVNQKCEALYTYANANIVASNFKTATIQDDRLKFTCNSSTGGTCEFKLDGKKLWATYSNPGGGTNNATFEKTGPANCKDRQASGASPMAA